MFAVVRHCHGKCQRDGSVARKARRSALEGAGCCAGVLEELFRQMEEDDCE